MALSKQISLYSIDTGFFYTEHERELHDKIMYLKLEKNKLKKERRKKIKEIETINNELKQDQNYIKLKDISNRLKELYLIRKEFKQMCANINTHELFYQYMDNERKIKTLRNDRDELNSIVGELPFKNLKETEIAKLYTKNNSKTKELKKELIQEMVNNSNIQRKITCEFKPRDIIAMFDSSLTRIIGAEPDTFTDDIMIVRVYYYEIFQNIVLNGFMYNDKKYVMWSASAGQIRSKKCVFIKEETLNKYYNTIYCGLSLDKINAPRIKIKDGKEVEEKGCNKNKYLAYTALVATASDKWDGFDIDRAIVVDDFENVVRGLVDYIDYNEYDKNNLWKIERKEMDITIPVMDGCGINLDYTGMVRLPWLKGLMVKFPFINFIKEQRKLEKEKYPKLKTTQIGKVKDIYGKEYDVLKDNIRYIFTKSQFKMWKYYDNWSQYKEYFKKYNCEACKCNEEDDSFDKAKTSYQPLQSLYDMSDKEILKILNKTNNDIKTIGNDRNKILKILGATEENINKNHYQEALMLYPEMINDTYSNEIMKLTKKSMVTKARYGKIQIDGTYTFIIPDLYAFAQWLFLHEENPKGLLKDGEVSCSLFENNKELDLIRSPHLNFSHCINTNILNDDIRRWFKSNGVYTSCHTLMSLELMYDVDGDTSLVIQDKTIIDVAKRIRKKHDIVPLYYELKKAKDDIINNESLYEGMISAYSGGNIGEVSNSITKIWNNGSIGEDELRAISYLTLNNNVVIDYAKTLWKPQTSQEMDIFLKQYTGKKLPHFFVYIKDKKKKEHQVEKVNNSVVNRLKYLVSNPRITVTAQNCGTFDYKNLLHNKDINTETELAQNIIKKFKYINANKKYIKRDDTEDKHDYTNKFIRKEILGLCNDVIYVTDVLVKYHYHDKNSKNKRTLWDVFGDIIIENIKSNIDLNTILCDRCGIRVIKEIPNSNIKYCDECARKINIEKTIKNRNCLKRK